MTLCHICGIDLEKPGAMFCSASHGPGQSGEGAKSNPEHCCRCGKTLGELEGWQCNFIVHPSLSKVPGFPSNFYCDKCYEEWQNETYSKDVALDQDE